MRRIGLFVAVMVLVGGLAVPAVAGGAEADRVEFVVSTAFVSTDPNNGIVVFAFMGCRFVHRVENPDGSAVETQTCFIFDNSPYLQLKYNPGTGTFERTEVEGGLPSSALTITAPPTPFGPFHSDCDWASDYWTIKDGSTVFAESWRMTVSPSGRVYMVSYYPAVPVTCLPGTG